jgi:hypothetical protein
MTTPTNCSTTVLESAIDWLTVSAHTPRLADRWRRHCLNLQMIEAHEGAKLRPFHLNQYVGQACGRVRFGMTHDACIVQLSGETAADEFNFFWPDHDTITRLDVAVTYRTPTDDPGVAAWAYDCAQVHRVYHPRAARPTLITNGDGGATLYLGSRTSSRFARLYNKHAESLEANDRASAERYDRAWRIEIELHDVDAQAVGMMLAEHGAPGPKIRYYIGHYLGQHGITCPYDMSMRETLPRGFRRRSDRETRLDWLGRTVRPTIDWLRSSCTVDELRDILGLEGESS